MVNFKIKIPVLLILCLFSTGTAMKADTTKIKELIARLKGRKAIPDSRIVMRTEQKAEAQAMPDRNESEKPRHEVSLNLFSEESPTDLNGGIDLPGLLSLVRNGNPEFAIYSLEFQKAEQRRRRSSKSPNPELEIEVENFGGTEDNKGFDSSETTLLLSQGVERGRKRFYRIREAELEEQLVRCERALKIRELEASVNERFIEAFFLQKQCDMQLKMLDWAEKVKKTVVERVNSGKVSPLELNRTEVEISKIRLMLITKRNDLGILKLKIAEMYGTDCFNYSRFLAGMEIREGLPGLELLKKKIESHPVWFMNQARLEYIRNQVQKRRSENVPDVTLSGGVKYDRGAEDRTFLVSMSIPLQVNYSGEEDVNLEKIEQKVTAIRARTEMLELKNRLLIKYGNLKASYEKLEIFQKDVLPAAISSFEGARTAYSQGKLGLLEVLDSQRSLAEIQEEYIETLSHYFIDLARIKELTGIPEELFSPVKSFEKRSFNHDK